MSRVNRKGQVAAAYVYTQLSMKHGGSWNIPQNVADAFDAIDWPATIKILGESVKVNKGEKKGYLSAVVYLAAGDRSKAYGEQEMCPWRSPSCGPLCLGHTTGRVALTSGQNAQAWKTLLFVHARRWFEELLIDDIRKHVERARRKGLTPCVRLNGSSDIPWERVFPDVFRAFPDLQFYDYTKSRARALDFATGAKGFPPNYHLTYSRSENDGNWRVSALCAEGVSVAVVGESVSTVSRILGRGLPVVDGDETDLRFLDPRGCLVWLSPKGTACKRDDTGFVVRELPVLA